MSAINIVDAMLGCYFLGAEPPRELSIGVFRKSGREVAVRGYSRVPFQADAFSVKDGNLFNKDDITFAPAHDDWGEVDSVAICSNSEKLVVFTLRDSMVVGVGARLRVPAKQLSMKLVSAQ